MNSALILDCSVAVTWLFTEEATASTREVLRRLDAASAVVPALWFLELANVIAVAERKGRVTLAQSATFIDDLGELPIEVEPESPDRALDGLLQLCRTHGLTSYDAVYLDLAARRRLPLATLDEPLRKAAKKLGIKLFGK
jgi:predicted nucleic acid-binding protein